jgi:hypothetical protein
MILINARFHANGDDKKALHGQRYNVTILSFKKRGGRMARFFTKAN